MAPAVLDRPARLVTERYPVALRPAAERWLRRMARPLPDPEVDADIAIHPAYLDGGCSDRCCHAAPPAADARAEYEAWLADLHAHRDAVFATEYGRRLRATAGL
jgi:hypothetical protein